MLHELTAAEMRVAKEMTKCGTREEVAERLFLSVNTVKMHIKNIYLKLNIHTETELWIVMACEALGKRFSAKELRERGGEYPAFLDSVGDGLHQCNAR